jgi:hypothetical protein
MNAKMARDREGLARADCAENTVWLCKETDRRSHVPASVWLVIKIVGRNFSALERGRCATATAN